MLLFCTFAALARGMLLRGSLSSTVYDDAMEDVIEKALSWFHCRLEGMDCLMWREGLSAEQHDLPDHYHGLQM